jgi:hypothetical protein
MIGMVDELAKNPSGWPDSDFKSVEDWQAKLHEIVGGLKAGKRLDDSDYPDLWKQLEAERPFTLENINAPKSNTEKKLWKEMRVREVADFKTFNKAMVQFTKYFFSLWD